MSGQKITDKNLEGKPFVGENRKVFKNFIKITDKENKLLAVLEENGETRQYDYCCVFPKS